MEVYCRYLAILRDIYGKASGKAHNAIDHHMVESADITDAGVHAQKQKQNRPNERKANLSPNTTQTEQTDGRDSARVQKT